MSVIEISWLDLSWGAVLVLALALVSHLARLGLGRDIVIAAVRTVLQLALIGLVLETLFELGALHWVALLAMAMLLIAGREVMARQQRRLKGGWAFTIGTLSMFVSSFTVTIFALGAVIGPQPWYQPQYAIPLLGMMLGNTMTGVALALDRLTEGAWQQRQLIEARLMLGQPWREAAGNIRREAMRSGMIPTINAMATAGVVSLPGMMTGQILAGTAPTLAVRYQVLIMFLVAAGTGAGTMIAVLLGSRRLSDAR